MFSSVMRRCHRENRRSIWPALSCYAWALVMAAIPAYSQAVIATVPVVGSELGTIAVNTVTNKVYALGGGPFLTVIDGASNTTVPITSPIPLFGGAIAVNETTNKIYTFGSPSPDGSDTVAVVDAATDTITLVTDPSGGLSAIAVNPVTNKIYVTDANGLMVIDGGTNAITNITSGCCAGGGAVAINSVTNEIYVSNFSSDNIAVIDGATNDVSILSDSNALGPGPLVVNPITNKIYVQNTNSANVTVIDGVTNSLTTLSVPNVSTSSHSLALNSVTNIVYTLSAAGLFGIDGATNSVFQLPLFPPFTVLGADSMAVNEVTNSIYISNPFFGVVVEVDAATGNSLEIEDPSALGPHFVTVNPVTDRIYVANDSNSVTVIDGGAPTPPSCQISQIVPGPPKQLIVAMQDRNSGLKSISLVDSANASVSIPAFSPGTTSQVLVTATKVDQTQSSDVAFQVTNMFGTTTSCDPVDFTVTLDGLTERHVFRSVSPAEHYIRITNGTRGVRQMTFSVNGHSFPVPALKDGETYSLDIGSAMAAKPESTEAPRIGARPVPRRDPSQAANNVVMYASGKRGSSAYILIGDASVLGDSAEQTPQ